MPVNDGQLFGWPFVNHAMEIRGTQTERGPGRTTIVYPRRKFTYLVQFGFNAKAIDPTRMQTNLLDFVKNGRLYATLKSIDHPKPRMKTEKLRSYNKDVIIPQKMEYDSASMSFHDDNSSLASALWREYRAFYQHEGEIGEAAIRNNRPTEALLSEFRQANLLVGSEVRADMSGKPSMGMRLKENDGRHFFDTITIYDLGSDPDSINSYVYLYPVINSLDHDMLDYEDRNSHVGMSMTFDYEGYYHLVGANNEQFRDFIESYLGVRPNAPSPRVGGHAVMTPPEAASVPAGTVRDAVGGLERSLPEPIRVLGDAIGLSDPIPTAPTTSSIPVPRPTTRTSSTPVVPASSPTLPQESAVADALRTASEESGVDIGARIRQRAEFEEALRRTQERLNNKPGQGGSR